MLIAICFPDDFVRRVDGSNTLCVSFWWHCVDAKIWSPERLNLVIHIAVLVLDTRVVPIIIDSIVVITVDNVGVVVGVFVVVGVIVIVVFIIMFDIVLVVVIADAAVVLSSRCSHFGRCW